LRLQNKRFLSLPAALFLLLVTNLSHCQIRPDIHKILTELGNNAQAYFLSANRPSYGVSAYTTPKHKLDIDISLSTNDEILELPVSISYGVSKNTEVFTGISLYTRTYDFLGNKIGGMGDANIGVKYKFQESDFFSHAVQMLVKLPTASSKSELGTGYADFHFGVAQGFSYENWGYDLSFELNFLKRRNFPTVRVPPELQRSIDSLKNNYNYKYEPEFVFTVGPSVDISDRIGVYGGVSFSRNMKLDFNTSEVYTGLGYELSDKTAIGIGASFGIKNASKWILSVALNLEI
jgi:outer membrane putative beta-barrel porin/alpha-amylase